MCDGSGWQHVEDTLYHFLDKKVLEEKMRRGEDSSNMTWRECKCYKSLEERKKIEKALRNAHTPEKYLDASISNFQLDKYTKKDTQAAAAYAKRFAAKYVEKFPEISKQGKGIYFYSMVKGSGKTRLAISIGNALFKKHQVSYIYKTATEIFDEITATFNTDRSTSDVVDVFKKAEVLIIDDIGVEETSNRRKERNVWKENTMTGILDYRMDNNLITIFTSNITIDELTSETLYPEGRVASRVRKIAYEVHMPEESVRDNEAVEENIAFEKELMG